MEDTGDKREDNEVSKIDEELTKETAEMNSKKEKDEYNSHKKRVKSPESKVTSDINKNPENKRGEHRSRHDCKHLPNKVTSSKYGAKIKTKNPDVDDIITRDPKENQKRTVAERKKRMEMDDRLMAQELACQQYFVDPVMTMDYPPRNRRIRVSNGAREVFQYKQNYFTIVKLMTFTGVPFFVINCVAGIEHSAFWWFCHGFLNALINLSIVATITLALQRNMLRLQKFSFFMCCISVGTSLLAVVISSIGMSMDRVQIITGVNCNDPYIVINGFDCRNYTDPVTHTLEYEAERVGYNSKQSMNLALVVLGIAQIMLALGAILTGRTFIFDLEDDDSDIDD